MKRFILTLSSYLLCLVLSACSHDNQSSDVTKITIDNNTNDISISTPDSEEITIDGENAPIYTKDGKRVTVIDIDEEDDDEYEDDEDEEDENDEEDEEDEDEEILESFSPEKDAYTQKKRTVQTYISASGKQVQSKEFEGPLTPDQLKLKDFERNKVEVKTVLVKPVVNAMYETQTISNDQAKNIAYNMQNTTIIDQEQIYQDPNVKQLMDNYINITKASSVCCVSKLAENLKRAGLNSENVLNVLRNDARKFYVQDTCLILSNEDIEDVFGNNAMSKIVKDTKKSCICANKSFIRKNIASFYKIYNQDPNFYKKVLLYRYKDNQGRITEHDINETILNISLALDDC